MSEKDGRRPPPPPPPRDGPRRPKPALEAGFDRWLDRQLHEIYDPVLEEAIPDEIASLLQGFGEREPPEDEGGGGGADGGGDGSGGRP